MLVDNDLKINVKCNLSVVIISCLLSFSAVLFLDRDLALFIHINNIDNLHWLKPLAEYMPYTSSIIVLIMLSKFYLIRSNKIITTIALIYFYIGINITMFIKTGLKIFFGRYWIKTWLDNNLSLVRDGVYGFNWLHGFGNLGSFPSGHSTYLAYCITLLVALYPRWSYLWVALGLLGIIPQILLDYHYLGDCLAGIGFGVLCATMFAYIWQQLRAK